MPVNTATTPSRIRQFSRISFYAATIAMDRVIRPTVKAVCFITLLLALAFEMLCIAALVAHADTVAPVVVAAAPTINLTGIATAVIAGIFGILTPVALLWVQSHIKNEAAKVTVANAVKNSLGAMQQAGAAYVTALSPQVSIPGVSPALATGIQYVLNNAGPEAERLGITPERIASKIDAQIGLNNIAANVAVAGSATPVVPRPLDPVPVVTKGLPV